MEASWGAASQRWIPLLYSFLSFHGDSGPGTEGTRLEKCRGRTPGEELGPEAPPAVSGEQGVCLGRGGVLRGRGAVASPGPLEGTARNRTLFSSKERTGGQDSSKARNGKKEMNPAPG